MTFLRQAALVLGTGYVLCFFSETMFWALWRPDDSPLGRLLQWWLYALMGYLTLVVIRRARLGDAWSLVLAGAFFGWMDEGVFAMTVYGDPSMPFPFTLAWTALAWHGPISLVIGWYGLGLALRHRTIWPTLGCALGFGAFWGVWGIGWAAETPPVLASPDLFLLHALATTLCLGVAHVLIAWAKPSSFAPGRIAVAVASLPVLGFFAAFTIPTIPIAPLVLLPLAALLGLALRRHHRLGRAPDLLARLDPPLRVLNLCTLPVMPVVAGLTYAAGTEAMAPQPAIHLGLAALTSLVGTVCLVVALTRIARRTPADPPAGEAHPT